MPDRLPSVEAVASISPDTLTAQDIARLNLCVADGLPHTGSLDVPRLLNRLDEWAEQVKFEICRHLYRIDQQSSQPPTEFSYGNSLGRFFCWFLLQVLQEDCGVAYHQDRKFKPDFCQPEDLFIHGIVDEAGKGGTCASMPVVYVAVGRRLGMPVFLVETRGHLFFRWDDPSGTTIQWRQPDLNLWIAPDRFNVEGSGEGIAYYPDSHYIQWPELWTEADFEHGRYLKCLTAQESLASFLVQRAECFHELGHGEECLKAIYLARQLAPDDRRYEWLHAKRTRDLHEHEQALERLFDLHANRQAQRRALPAMLGHSPNCYCLQCEQARDINQSRPTPPHGPSCQCAHCLAARKAAAAPVGVPGHPPTCQCAGCLQHRIHAQTFGVSGIVHPPELPRPHIHQPPIVGHAASFGQPHLTHQPQGD